MFTCSMFGYPRPPSSGQAIVDPGDNVLVVSPVWPNIRAAIEIFSAEPRDVALGRTNDGGFRLDLAALEAGLDSRTKAVFVNSPSNPSGAVFDRGELERIFRVAKDRGIWILADECYERFLYASEPFSLASLPGAKVTASRRIHGIPRRHSLLWCAASLVSMMVSRYINDTV